MSVYALLPRARGTSSSVEPFEDINCMHDWYGRLAVRYVYRYLSDIPTSWRYALQGEFRFLRESLVCKSKAGYML